MNYEVNCNIGIIPLRIEKEEGRRKKERNSVVLVVFISFWLGNNFRRSAELEYLTRKTPGQ